MRLMCSYNRFTTPKASVLKPDPLTKAVHAHSFMRMNIRSKISKKKSVNLSIDEELLSDSKDAGVNLSKVLEERLKEIRDANFKRQLAAFIAYENEQIEKYGIWSDGKRGW
jgi:post-segregation antitoxin (ccd killing protein)